MSLRTAFVDRFGEDAAQKIEDAAAEHENYQDGSVRDTFKVALLIVIAYGCVETGQLRAAHGITRPAAADFTTWVVARSDKDLTALLYDPDSIVLTKDAITKEYA